MPSSAPGPAPPALPGAPSATPTPAEPPAPEASLLLEGTSCQGCGRIHAPARRYRCLGCGGSSLAPTQVPLSGTLETFTELKVPVDAEGMKTGLAIVRLDAGPMLTGQLKINGVPPTVGGRVRGRVVAAREGEQAVQRFQFTPEAEMEVPPMEPARTEVRR